MLESLNFNFDGTDSTDYPIININVGNGLFTETFMSQRTILEDKVRGNDKPYFQGIERQPLSFPLSFYFTDTWDEDTIRQIVRWLDVDYYRPFYFLDYPDRIFYVMVTDTSTIIHNGLKQGYVTLTLRCDSPYAVSPTFLTEIFNYSDNETDFYEDTSNINDTLNLDDSHTFYDTDNATIFIDSLLGISHTADTSSDLILDIETDSNISPQIWITKVGLGNVTITNMTNRGVSFTITSLNDGETVYLDCEQEYIESDIPGIYRYNNFSGDFMEFIYGKNILHISGNCKIQMQYESKYGNGIL